MSVPPTDPQSRTLNVLLWHVHGSWTTSFVQGRHNYLLPTDPALGEWARGRCGRPWPDRVVEVAPAALRDAEIDVVLLQRPRELELVREWLGRVPGSELPALYVEHNTPREHAATTRHPLADHTDIPLVHVTNFNRLMWDNGRCPTRVIPHGVIDPGYLYTGEMPRAATTINEPVRRWRVTGTDLLADLSDAAPIDVYGIGTDTLHTVLNRTPDRISGCGDLTQATLHRELGRHRVFLHTPRWTSLGMSVIEAMYLGMPVVAVGTTEASASVPAEAGVVSTDPDILAEAVRQFIAEPVFAELTGKSARHWAQANFGIAPFVRRWDRLLTEQAATARRATV
ncbi:glycosyltransferase [Nocardia sp. CDC159]|uniref:Glycosyltransferase n=1 Tax=Nocardia pulmonis TaxID=2951408 RepID=A0A9X2E2X3_9NOCA|nr:MULTISPECIES: glycosyltransferase [Nocardia]MCM6772113.1 glycosyltransferase [Nocardia pulmonis]MCM6785229.1 glycosyltransferase [Nocardia sp. CDC159]